MARSSTTFRPGQCGNPNGRPRVDFEIRDVARRYGPDCIRILAKMAGIDGPGAANEAVRVAAARELLDRGFGKATTTIAGAAEAAPVHCVFEWADALPGPEATSVPIATTAALAADDGGADTQLIVRWDGGS